jgi:hypothetical protein
MSMAKKQPRKIIVIASLFLSTPSSSAFNNLQWKRGHFNMAQKPSTTFQPPPFLSTMIQSRVYANKSEKDNGGSSASVRFSGVSIESSSKADDITNSLDFLLGLVVSDIASIILGSIGLAFVVFHRLSLLDEQVADTTILAQQTRTDLLAVFASGSVLLNGITKLDITSALSESVVLEGTKLGNPIVDTENPTIQWGLQALLRATPAKTAVIMEGKPGSQWSIIALAGIVPSQNNPLPENTPILDRVGSQTTKETYLPTLQALPGRFEFSYLPANSQLALLIPLSATASVSRVLVLGSNTAKSFTPRDIAWCRVVAERMASSD